MVLMSPPVCVVRDNAAMMSGAAMCLTQGSVSPCPGCVIATMIAKPGQTSLSAPPPVCQRSSPVLVGCVYSLAGDVTGKTTVVTAVTRKDARQRCAHVGRCSAERGGVSRTVMCVMVTQVRLCTYHNILQGGGIRGCILEGF